MVNRNSGLVMNYKRGQWEQNGEIRTQSRISEIRLAIQPLLFSRTDLDIFINCKALDSYGLNVKRLKHRVKSRKIRSNKLKMNGEGLKADLCCG